MAFFRCVYAFIITTAIGTDCVVGSGGRLRSARCPHSAAMYTPVGTAEFVFCVFLCRYRLVHVKNTTNYSPSNVNAVFSIQTVKFCTRLLCVIAKTSLVGFLFIFCLIFRQLIFFEKCDPPYANFFRRKKKRRSDLGMGMYNTCKISGSVSRTRRGHLAFCA